MVTPVSKSYVRFPVLLTLSWDSPILLRLIPALLVNPDQLTHPLILEGSLSLMAWRITGGDSRSQLFRIQLRNSCPRPGPMALSNDTNQLGLDGPIDVCDGVSIPWQQT